MTREEFDELSLEEFAAHQAWMADHLQRSRER